jgi:hypothetical protein
MVTPTISAHGVAEVKEMLRRCRGNGRSTATGNSAQDSGSRQIPALMLSLCLQNCLYLIDPLSIAQRMRQRDHKNLQIPVRIRLHLLETAFLFPGFGGFGFKPGR